MIRILHAADLHLDSPFQGLGREKAIQRRQEQRQLLERIGALARQRSVDMAVFAGDLFDSEDAFAETGKSIQRVLSGLEIPVFVAPGNHDWYGAHSPWARLKLGENVHVFTQPTMECVSLPELGVRVWGTAFTQRHRTAPLAGFEAAKEGDTLDIMAVHGEVGNPASVYGAISEQELARSGMDYVALGHVHSYSGLRQAGETFYAWPGCPEGRGFDEPGDKGVLLVELEPGKCRAEFVPVAERRYQVLSVDITDAEDVGQAVAQALPPDTSRDSYRIYLTGQTDGVPDGKRLYEALASRFFSLELRDETTLRRDVWAERSADSLKGLFLSRLWQQLTAAQDDRERERITQAARWGLQALEKGEELPL
jgi:DNA repair exonuclease SbcCD nuclease subunit